MSITKSYLTALRQAVASKLRLNWAPEQIAGWLKRAHPEDEFYHVSHETIYRSLFVQTRGVLKKELLGHLRSKRTMRRSKQAKTLPNELYKSLTWDRGKELADHRRFTLATNIAVYFCDPQSPWQRGSNENTNGLLRQYFPKGTDLSVYSQTHLKKVARQLNERPRETLEYETPAERFNACVASTG